MIIETISIVCAGLVGRYLLPSKKSRRLGRRLGRVAAETIGGTYRDPALYHVTLSYPGEPDKHYNVKNLFEIPMPDREAVKKAFKPKHDWFNRFLTGKDAVEE